MANSVMERIMEQRHSLGLPAKAIQWGAVGEVGLVADMVEDSLDMEIGGTLQQRISSCLEELDTLLSINEPIVASMVVAEKRYSASAKGSIFDTVMNVMGIRDIKSVSLETTLTELGMDSLMAVELKQIFEREYEINLSTQELRALTFTKIMEFAKARESHDGKDDLKATSDVTVDAATVLMRYLGDETFSDETILRLDTNKTYNSKCPGLLIPGIEGMASDSWYKISHGVDFPTGILQLKKTSHASSLEETVRIIEEVSCGTIFPIVTNGFLIFSTGCTLILSKLNNLPFDRSFFRLIHSVEACRKIGEQRKNWSHNIHRWIAFANQNFDFRTLQNPNRRSHPELYSCSYY
jgi:fatty acid synthase